MSIKSFLAFSTPVVATTIVLRLKYVDDIAEIRQFHMQSLHDDLKETLGEIDERTLMVAQHEQNLRVWQAMNWWKRVYTPVPPGVGHLVKNID